MKQQRHREQVVEFDQLRPIIENVQPRRQGHSASSLAKLASQPVGQLDHDRQLKREEFEQELTAWQELDDPLETFICYIRWLQDSYPEGPNSSNHLINVLERCTRLLKDDSRYRNDPRFLRCWIHYAHLVRDPREIFAFLECQQMFTGLALMYEEYSAVLESYGRWQAAEEVYQQGIQRQASPLERLKRKYAEFLQRRLNNAENRADIVEEQNIVPRLQGSDGGLSQSDGRRNITSSDNTLPVVTNSKISIYRDPEGVEQQNNSSAQWLDLQLQSDQVKENTVKAGPWAGQKSLSRPPPRPQDNRIPKLEIFRDEHQQQQAMAASRGNVMQSLDNFPQSSLAVDPLKDFHRRVDNKALLESRKERVQFDIDAVYGGRNERSFEEIRAVVWKEAEKQRSLAAEEAQRKLDRGLEIREKQAEKEVEDQQRQSFRREPTMTFHTKEALADVISMFNRPLAGQDDNDEGEHANAEKYSAPINPQPIQDISNSDDDEEEGFDECDAIEKTCTIVQLPVQKLSFNKIEIYRDDGECSTKAPFDYSSAKEFCERKPLVPLYSDKKSTARSTELPAHLPTEEVDHVSPIVLRSSQNRSSSLMKQQEVVGSGLSATPSVSHYQYAADMPSDCEEVAVDRKFIVEDDRNSPFDDDQPTAPPPVSSQSDLPEEEFVVGSGGDGWTGMTASQRSMQRRMELMTPITEVSDEATCRLGSHRFSAVGSGRTSLVSQDGTVSLRPWMAQRRVSMQAETIQEDPVTTAFEIPDFSVGDFHHVDSAATTLGKQLADSLQLDSHREPILNDQNVIEWPNRAMMTSLIGRYQPSIFVDHQLTECPHPAASKWKRGTLFQLSDHSFFIERQVGSGAYGSVYAISSSDDAELEEWNDEPLCIKVESPCNHWEFYILSQLHERCGGTESFIRPLRFYTNSDDSSYLMMPLAGRHTLLDAINACYGPDRSMDELLSMFFASKLLKALVLLHSKGRIIHGDLKPDNILVKFSNFGTSNSVRDGTGLVLIDFGKSIDMTLFDKTLLFRNDWKEGDGKRRRPKDLFDYSLKRPFNWSLDVQGALSIIHCLLFGQYLTYNSREIDECTTVNVDDWKWKRYWQSEKWRRWTGNLVDMCQPHAVQSWDSCVKQMDEIVSEMTEYLDENAESHGKSLSSLIRQLEIRLS